MATRLTKRADGRYCKQVTCGIKNGKPVKKSFYGTTIKEVEKKVRDFESLRDRGFILEHDNITFEELSDMWMQNEKSYSLKTQSYNNMMSQIRTINSYLGSTKVKLLRQSHIEEMKAVMIQGGRIDQYNKALASIRSILSYAQSKDIIYKDITVGMKKIRYNGLREKRSLTQEERILIDKADLNDFERCFLNLLLYTGLRRNEALALTVSDINFKERSISINKTLVASATKDNLLQDNTKTRAGTRLLPISDQLYPVLHDYCKDKAGILFSSVRGGYITSAAVTKRWRGILEKLAAVNDVVLADDITPHIFRHTYASDLYKSGIDIKTAQYLLGHTDVKTTLDTYTHFGYVDVKIDQLEEYYKSVKCKSDSKIVQIKHA